MISSWIFVGTRSKWLGSMTYVARPEERERSSVEYPNISLKGTSAWIIDCPFMVFLSEDLAAAAVEVADDISHMCFGSCHIDFHDRF